MRKLHEQTEQELYTLQNLAAIARQYRMAEYNHRHDFKEAKHELWKIKMQIEILKADNWYDNKSAVQLGIDEMQHSIESILKQ